MTDIAWSDTDSLWAGYSSGCFTQHDVRFSYTPLDSIPRHAITRNAVGGFAFITGKPRPGEIPFDDVYVDVLISRTKCPCSCLEFCRSIPSMADAALERGIKPKTPADAPFESFSQVGSWAPYSEYDDYDGFVALARAYVLNDGTRLEMCARNAQVSHLPLAVIPSANLVSGCTRCWRPQSCSGVASSPFTFNTNRSRRATGGLHPTTSIRFGISLALEQLRFFCRWRFARNVPAAITITKPKHSPDASSTNVFHWSTLRCELATTTICFRWSSEGHLTSYGNSSQAWDRFTNTNTSSNPRNSTFAIKEYTTTDSPQSSVAWLIFFDFLY